MMPARFRSLWPWLAYFLILMSIALWVRDIPNQLDVFSSIQQILDRPRLGDPRYFAKAAMDVAETGWVSHSNATVFVFNLWPPGFVLLEALLIKVFGTDGPIILLLQTLAAALFSFVLVLIYNLLRTCIMDRVAFVLPLMIFAFPVSRVALLEPTGVTLGETFAIGFFLLGVLLAYRAIEKDALRYAGYAGLFLALSAYFRSQFEFILMVMTAWAILIGVIFRLLKSRRLAGSPALTSTIKTMGIMLLVAHAVMIPWRTYHYINQGTPFWVEASFKNAVMTSDHLNGDGAGFVVAGGGNLVCRIDPNTCGDVANAKMLVIKTFLSSPVEWYSYKLERIGAYWYSPIKYWVSPKGDPTVLDIGINGLILGALIVTVALLFTRKVRSHSSWMLFAWLCISLLSAYAVIFTLAHFESRYFYFPKIMSIVMALIIACVYYRMPNKTTLVSRGA